MDALLSPLVVCVAGPLLTWALLRVLQRGRGHAADAHGSRDVLAALVLEACMVALVYLGALHVIGPELIPVRAAIAAQGSAFGTAALTVVAASLAQRKAGIDTPSLGRQLLVGAVLLTTVNLVVALGPWPAPGVVACALALTLAALGTWAWRRSRKNRVPSGESAAGLVLAFTLSIAAWAGSATLLSMTAIADEDVSQCTLSRARLRMRVSPWDGNARLALAWVERRTRHLDRAEERGEEAVRLGADAATTLDFFAELAAARGDCTESYARFESALRIRAAEAFTGVLERPLELGESALPPTYIRDCLRPPEAEDAPDPRAPNRLNRR